jgi:ammonium transporter, Amt family
MTTNLPLEQQIEKLSNRLSVIQEANDVRWLALTGSNTFLMVLGLALLEAGSLRAKNLSMVMMKQVVVAAICGVIWYLWGHGLAFGSNVERSTRNNFIGSAKFALTDIEYYSNTAYVNWLFQMTFCTVSCSVISGAIGERLKFMVYFWYIVLQAGWIYPITAYAQWSDHGWNSPANDGTTTHTGGGVPYVGAIDGAGCGPVHIVGGVAAFVGAYICGPRTGRFDKNGNVLPMPGHSSALVCMGVLILWFAWFSFNSGARVIDQSKHHLVISRSVANTMIASCTAGLTTLIAKAAPRDFNYFPLNSMLSGILTGLVAITAGSTVVEPWAAFIFGVLAALVYLGLTHLELNIFKIDDPVEAWPVHFGGGVLGLILTSFFAQPDATRLAYDKDIPFEYAAGAFMGGNGKMIAYNLICILFCTLWSAFFTYVYFKGCDAIWGIRVSVEEERTGMSDVFGDGYDYVQSIQQVSQLNTNLNYLRSTLMDGTAATPDTNSQSGADDGSSKTNNKPRNHASQSSSFAGTQQDQHKHKIHREDSKDRPIAGSNTEEGDEDEELSFVDFTANKQQGGNEPAAQ